MFDFSYFPEIETERLLLRRMTHDDAAALVEEFSHPKVMEHLNPDPPIDTIENAQKFLERMNSRFIEKTGLRWGVILKKNNKLIGTAGFLHYEKADKRSEIGYDYNFDYWNKGYASEVVNRLVQFGFDELKLHRIEAECNEGNIGSARVLEKAGFTFEGLWRDRIIEYGKFVSLKQYSILEHEYHAPIA